LSVPY
ncbi:hypothetical protein CFC21_111195, partial [Triticum aestivum]